MWKNRKKRKKKAPLPVAAREYEAKFFDLVPTTSPSRVFVRLGQATLTKLVNLRTKEKAMLRKDVHDIDDVLSLVVKPATLRRFQKRGTCFGATIRTDGIQLQLQKIDATAKEEKKMRREARKKVAEEEVEDDVAEEDVEDEEIDERTAVHKEGAKRPTRVAARAKPTLFFPKGGIPVGFDPGHVNILVKGKGSSTRYQQLLFIIIRVSMHANTHWNKSWLRQGGQATRHLLWLPMQWRRSRRRRPTTRPCSRCFEFAAITS